MAKPNPSAYSQLGRIFFCAAIAVAFSAHANDATRYQLPPVAMIEMVDAQLIPQTLVSPNNDWIVLMDRPALPSVNELAQPELRLAGLRINPRSNDLSRTNNATGMRLVKIADRIERIVTGLPGGARIGDVLWSPDGKRIAMTVVRETSIELMVMDVTNGFHVKRVTDRPLNGVMGRAFSWFGDSKSLLVALIPHGRGAPPKVPLGASGPSILENMGKRNVARTYQNLLKSTHDEALFDYYAAADVSRVWLDGKIAQIATGVVRGFAASPDGQYAMVQTIKRPYSYNVPVSRFPVKTEIRDALEANIGGLVRVLSETPLTEDEELDADAVQKGPRQYSWRSDANATITWAQAIEMRKNGLGDYLFMLVSPFDGEPVLLEKMELRYQSILWGNDNVALLTEASRKSRKSVTWRVYPGEPTRNAVKFFERSLEDRYNDPGTPVTETNPRGYRVLDLSHDGRAIYLSGTGASPEGDRPFVDRLELESRETRRLFRSEAPYYDAPMAVIDDSVNASAIKLLLQRESAADAPNMYLRDLNSGKMQQLTKFATPKNPLANVTREIIKYKRRDGLDLSATLYLPAGFKRGDEPLPLLMWAYPREFRSADAAGQFSGSPYRYVRPSFSGPLPFLTQGYAVLDNPAMPIVAENGKEPNDNYLPQLIASAEAAIDEVVRRGVADRSKIAVGGHSYGAFMVANLLAHTKLFAAGIAESGAYNRTLTPFGFQAEDRTYWKARDVYSQMSPFNYADQIKTPLLLIHGEADSNTGTFPVQSERFYQAIRGMGGTARLVMLPYEDHGYRGRESVLHRLWEEHRWLEKFVKTGDKKRG